MSDFQIVVRENKEDRIIKAANTGEDMFYWRVIECPLKDDCNAAAWKKGKVWSWQSEEACRSYVAGHLNRSGKHQLNESDAVYQAMFGAVAREISTFEEREKEREEDRQNNEERDFIRAHAPTSPPHPPPRALLAPGPLAPATPPIPPPRAAYHRSRSRRGYGGHGGGHHGGGGGG